MSFFGLFGGRKNRDADPIDEIPLQLRLRLMNWVKAFATIPGGRQHLETHLELLQDESEQFFTLLIAKAEDNSDLTSRLSTSREILHTSRLHGSTKEAVRDAFIDEFGAFIALDLPPQLEALRKRMGEGITVSALIPLLRDAVARSQRDSTVPIEVTASLQVMLGEILQSETEDEYSEVIELAEPALKAFPPDRFPKQFARTQGLLGSAYVMQGREAQNGSEREKRDMQRAIACFKAVLTVVTREAQPDVWRQTQMRLAVAYETMGAMRCAKLHFSRVLEGFSREDNPQLYEMVEEKVETIALALEETELYLENLEDIFDPDMIEGMREQMSAVLDGDCAEELGEAVDEEVI